MAKKWFSITAKKSNSAPEILIYDEIGAWGVSATAFYQALKELGLKEGDEATLRINSPGGDCFMGNAIFNMLMDTKAKWTIHIDGVAASMASLIATLPGAHVIIAANAFLMIHNPAAWASGESKDMQRTAKLLDSIRDGMAKAYAERSGLEEAEVTAMMDAETWLDADEAIRLGFADEKGEENRLAAKFDLESKFKDIPANVAKTLGKAAKPAPQPKESTMDKNELAEALAANNKTLADSIVTGLAAALAPKPEAKDEADKAADKAATTLAANIKATCKLAGHEGLAEDYVASGMTLAEVREDLKAKATAKPQTPRGSRPAPVTGRINTHGGGAETEQDDYSDLIPAPITEAKAFANFHGEFANRRH